VKRTAFFRGKCFKFSCNEFVLRAGADAAAGDGRKPVESHGTRSLREESERPLRGVDSVLEVAVEKEADVADRSDVMEWLTDDDGPWLDFFREERAGNVCWFDDADVGRDCGREGDWVERS